MGIVKTIPYWWKNLYSKSRMEFKDSWCFSGIKMYLIK